MVGVGDGGGGFGGRAVVLDWEGGSNFFARYALTRVRGPEADVVFLYGQGGFGAVFGCELVEATGTGILESIEPPPTPLVDLVVKRIDPPRLSRREAEDLYNREVCTAYTARVAMERRGLAYLLAGILDGYMCHDSANDRFTIFAVMERLTEAVPHPFAIPHGAPMPAPGHLPVRVIGGDADLMDYVGGTTRHPPRLLTPFAARMVVKQLLTVLAALHEEGYVHRDVKLDNVFIAGSEGTGDLAYLRVKLGDFSLMRNYGDPTTPITSTAPMRDFQPPEQTQRPLPPGFTYDGRLDVFSVGCVWYAAITGMSPRNEDAVAAVSPALKALVRRPPAEPDRDEAEARALFDARFPLGFRKADGRLTSDGVLLMAMTRRCRDQRLTAAEALLSERMN